MKNKDRNNLYSIQFALIILLVSVVISIVFLQYRINNIATYKDKYKVRLPPNGTALSQPSPTPSFDGRIINPGLYASNEHKISLTIPDGFHGTTVIDQNNNKILSITRDTDSNIVINISGIKKVRGYGSAQKDDQTECNPILLHGLPIQINNKTVERCTLANKLNSYSTEIQFPYETPLNLFISYDYKRTPTSDELIAFDQIIKSIQFLQIPKKWSTYTNYEIGFEISYPVEYNVLTDKKSLSGWPHAIALVHNGGQAFDIAIEIWGSKNEMESARLNKGYSIDVYHIDGNYITVWDSTNDSNNPQILSTMRLY